MVCVCFQCVFEFVRVSGVAHLLPHWAIPICKNRRTAVQPFRGAVRRFFLNWGSFTALKSAVSEVFLWVVWVPFSVVQ